MVFRIIYGEITDKRKACWNSDEENPFDITKNEIEIDEPASWGWVGFLNWADTNLHDKIAVDCGSFAWKCTGSALKRLKIDGPSSKINGFDSIDEEKEYGVVFIEMS